MVATKRGYAVFIASKASAIGMEIWRMRDFGVIKLRSISEKPARIMYEPIHGVSKY